MKNLAPTARQLLRFTIAPLLSIAAPICASAQQADIGFGLSGYGYAELSSCTAFPDHNPYRGRQVKAVDIMRSGTGHWVLTQGIDTYPYRLTGMLTKINHEGRQQAGCQSVPLNRYEAAAFAPTDLVPVPNESGQFFVVGTQRDADAAWTKDTVPELGYGMVFKYNADGSRVSAYGIGGEVRLKFPALDGRDRPLRVEGGTALGDGSLLLVGTIDTQPTISERGKDLLVVRLLPNGRLDRNFANYGALIYDLDWNRYVNRDDVGARVLVDSEGRILVGGTRRNADVASPRRVQDYDPFVIRLDEYGVFDTTFGVGGAATVPFNRSDVPFQANVKPSDYLRDMVLQPDGSIVMLVAIQIDVSNAPYAQRLNIGLARLDSDGHLDPMFGTDADGTMVLPWHRNTTQLGDRLALAGRSLYVSGSLGRDDGTYQVFLARLEAHDGSLDYGFGTDGWYKIERPYEPTLDLDMGERPEFGTAMDTAFQAEDASDLGLLWSLQRFPSPHFTYDVAYSRVLLHP